LIRLPSAGTKLEYPRPVVVGTLASTTGFFVPVFLFFTSAADPVRAVAQSRTISAITDKRRITFFPSLAPQIKISSLKRLTKTLSDCQ